MSDEKRVMAGRLYQVNLLKGYGIITTPTGEQVELQASCLKSCGLTDMVEMGRHYEFEAERRGRKWHAVRILESFPKHDAVRTGKLVVLPAEEEFGILDTGTDKVLVTRRSFNLSGFTWLEIGHEFQFEMVPVGSRFRAARIISRSPLE